LIYLKTIDSIATGSLRATWGKTRGPFENITSPLTIPSVPPEGQVLQVGNP